MILDCETYYYIHIENSHHFKVALYLTHAEKENGRVVEASSVAKNHPSFIMLKEYNVISVPYCKMNYYYVTRNAMSIQHYYYSEFMIIPYMHLYYYILILSTCTPQLSVP